MSPAMAVTTAALLCMDNHIIMQGDANNAMSANNKDCQMQGQAMDEGQSKISRLDLVLDVSFYRLVLGWQAPAALSNSIGRSLS